MKKNKGSKFLFGFLIGGIVGAGMYFAVGKKKEFKMPQSLLDSRDEILDHGEYFVDEIKQYVSPSVESVKHNTIPIYDRVVDSLVPIVEDVLDRSISLIEDIRNRVSPTAEEIRSRVDSFSSNQTSQGPLVRTDGEEEDDTIKSLDNLDVVPNNSDKHSIN